MEVDYEKLGNVIDGCVISADDLPAMQNVSEDKDERAKLLLDETAHIMAALAECELIISNMRRRIKAWCAT